MRKERKADSNTNFQAEEPALLTKLLALMVVLVTLGMMIK